MSIVRVGLSETKHYAEGFEAIFGKKKDAAARKPKAKTAAKASGAKKKKAVKKKK